MSRGLRWQQRIRTRRLHVASSDPWLGTGVRVVSMPCMERFDRQDAAYRDSVLPPSCRRRIAIEAGIGQAWYKYTGLDGRVIGIEQFGISAPGNTVMKELGISADTIVKAAGEL